MWPFRTRTTVEAKTRNFEAAAGGRRWQGAGWLSNVNAASAATNSTIRARARHAVANNPHAARAAWSWAANVIGAGIVPQSAAADASAIDAVFSAWTREADAAGLTDFYGLQAAVVRSVFVAGEAFIRFRPRLPEDGLAVPVQLELLDPGQIDAGFHRELSGGARIVSGVEFDPIGRRVAYHVLRHAPGDPLGTATFEPARVPAEDVCHVLEPLAPGQVRGVSRLAVVLLRLRDLDELQDAALMRAKVEALLGGFVTDPEGTLFDGKAGGSILESGLEPGALKILPPGTSISFNDPKAGGTNYSEFCSAQLHAIAAGLGLTYEQLTGDMTGVNYSSARVALIEFRRLVEAYRWHTLVPQFLDRAWRRVIDTAVLAGALPTATDPRCEWVPPAWEWVDPEADVSANVKAVEAGFKSRRQVIAELGRDPDQVAAEIADEVEAAA